jgi:hypothetical protein
MIAAPHVPSTDRASVSQATDARRYLAQTLKEPEPPFQFSLSGVMRSFHNHYNAHSDCQNSDTHRASRQNSDSGSACPVGVFCRPDG